MGMKQRLEDMLAAGRDDPMLRFGLGSACVTEGSLEDAVTHLSACIEQNPDYSAAYKLLGKTLFDLARYEAAEQVYRDGLDVAGRQGDKQSEKEMKVFLGKIAKQLKQ